MNLKEEKDCWSLILKCGRVQLIQIDFRLNLLVLDGTDKLWLHVETPGTLRTQVGDVLLVPEQPATLAPILPLFNAEVIAINISKAGQLQIKFGHDGSFEVTPDHSYEAWQVECSSEEGDFMLVCPPGGEVTLFRDVRRTSDAANFGLH
jgi:hypothetical protein